MRGLTITSYIGQENLPIKRRKDSWHVNYYRFAGCWPNQLLFIYGAGYGYAPFFICNYRTLL